MKKKVLSAAILSAAVVMSSSLADDKSVTVNVDNFVRAETSLQFDRFLKTTGKMNTFAHNRTPTPLDQQSVIRMNRDTLYSYAVVDISKGATLTLPDAGDRYMSAMIVNEDQYINEVFHGGGTYKINMDVNETPFVLVFIRLLANPVDPEDIKIANSLQDKMKIDAASANPYTHLNYDDESYQATYKPLLALSEGIPDASRMFGKKNEVTEVRYLLGSAFGWGGLPTYEAVYETYNQPRKAGEYQLTVKDVPVDGFWSISIYNRDGYYEENKFNSYSINNLTAKANKDGSYTVNFGGCEDGRINCLYIMDGWNYAVRLYQPREEIQQGKWKFPIPEDKK
jgi:hypothetical protein